MATNQDNTQEEDNTGGEVNMECNVCWQPINKYQQYYSRCQQERCRSPYCHRNCVRRMFVATGSNQELNSADPQNVVINAICPSCANPANYEVQNPDLNSDEPFAGLYSEIHRLIKEYENQIENANLQGALKFIRQFLKGRLTTREEALAEHQRKITAVEKAVSNPYYFRFGVDLFVQIANARANGHIGDWGPPIRNVLNKTQKQDIVQPTYQQIDNILFQMPDAYQSDNRDGILKVLEEQVERMQKKILKTTLSTRFDN